MPVFYGKSERRVMDVFYFLSERWQRTSPIVYGVSERRPLRWKFMNASSALMHIIQNTKVTSTHVPLHTTAKDLYARVMRLSGKTSRNTDILVVAASGASFVLLPS